MYLYIIAILILIVTCKPIAYHSIYTTITGLCMPFYKHVQFKLLRNVGTIKAEIGILHVAAFEAPSQNDNKADIIVLALAATIRPFQIYCIMFRDCEDLSTI